jgi:Tol biopolymer transport system component
VVFSSYATNLVISDTNGIEDVFVHDRQTGMTRRVSVNSIDEQGNGGSSNANISDDGRHVVFNSYANNLVISDTNGLSDIFVHDLETGITERVNISSEGNQASWFSD